MKVLGFPVALFIQYLLITKGTNSAQVDTKIDEKSLKMYDKETEATHGEVNLGKKYFEGDLLLTQQQKDYLKSSKKANDIQVRALIKDFRKLWPNGVVPYTLADNLREESRKEIQSAIEEWNQKTCLQFREKNDADADYIEFVYDEGKCSSRVGRIGGRQEISVGTSDGSVTCRHGEIVHQIVHAVGFFHEHTRPDRDEYVTVHWNNIMSGHEDCFEKNSLETVDSLGVSYDYDSVMHYRQFFFAKQSGLKTLEPKDPTAAIGQRIGLSHKDVVQANLLYNYEGFKDKGKEQRRHHKQQEGDKHLQPKKHKKQEKASARKDAKIHHTRKKSG